MQDWKIWVAETDTLVRHGIVSTLQQLSGVQIIEHGCGTPRDAPLPAGIDVVVLGPHANGEPAQACLARIRSQRPDVPMILLSGSPATSLPPGVTQIQIGAHTLESLIGVITLLRGPSRTPVSTPGLRITARQTDVLQLMSRGYMNKQIARELSLSENTIRWHVQALLDTLRASNRTQAVTYAREAGLLP